MFLRLPVFVFRVTIEIIDDARLVNIAKRKPHSSKFCVHRIWRHASCRMECRAKKKRMNETMIRQIEISVILPLPPMASHQGSMYYSIETYCTTDWRLFLVVFMRYHRMEKNNQWWVWGSGQTRKKNDAWIVGVRRQLLAAVGNMPFSCLCWW